MSIALLSSTCEFAFQQYEAAPIRLQAVDGPTWNRFVSGFVDVLHEQMDSFDFPEWEANKERVMGFHNGNPIGGTLVKLAGVPLLGTGVAVVPSGPIWRRNRSAVELKWLALLVQALKEEYAIRRGYYLVIRPRPEPEAPHQAEGVLRDAGFQARPDSGLCPQFFVNTEQSADALMKSLSQKWRYNLKQAHRNSLAIEFSSDPNSCDIFIQMYREMLERKHYYDTSPVARLPLLMRAEVEALRPRIVIVRHGGSPVAGGVLGIHGDRAVYLYGATTAAAVPLKAGYAMHWHIAEFLCRQPEVRWYDLGGAPPESQLQQFKRGFVGSTGAILNMPPPFHFGATAVAHLVGRAAYLSHRHKAYLTYRLQGLRRWLAL